MAQAGHTNISDFTHWQLSRGEITESVENGVNVDWGDFCAGGEDVLRESQFSPRNWMCKLMREMTGVIGNMPAQ